MVIYHESSRITFRVTAQKDYRILNFRKEMERLYNITGNPVVLSWEYHPIDGGGGVFVSVFVFVNVYMFV